MRNIVSVLILILSCLGAFGQRGFYTTDSTTSVGVKIIDNGRIENGRWCEVKNGNKTDKYSPHEVEIYGFNNRRIYVSKKITYSDSSNVYFLEQLSAGQLTLYYFADKKYNTYFIEKDSTTFFELSKGKKSEHSYYQKQLQEMGSDFPEIYNNAKLVRYNRRSLSKFIDEYNNRLYKPFPYFKIGLVGLTEMSQFIPPQNASNGSIGQINYDYDNSLGAGVFMDIPIDVSNFSCHMEILYTNHSYSFSTESTNGIIDFAANTSSGKVPIMLRYTYPSKKISPFLNAGAIIAYHTNKKSKLFETIFSDNTGVIEDITDEPLLSDFQKGGAAGVGTEYRLDYKHSLFFELRFNRFFGEKKTLHSADLQFLASFNF